MFPAVRSLPLAPRCLTAMFLPCPHFSRGRVVNKFNGALQS